MTTKQQFLSAVQILAPGDNFIFDAAQKVREETLPQVPGGAALEFVSAMVLIKERCPSRPKPIRKARTLHLNSYQRWVVVNPVSKTGSAEANLMPDTRSTVQGQDSDEIVFPE